ncbi:MAG TPA: FHA domain-containing protein [Anaerolineaceae bacterium]|nr:FHA domain-containing protein [Anaerolineaceae bacterium]
MNATLQKALSVLLVFILFFSIINEVVAQDQPQLDVRVNTIATIELPDSVNLKVYFNFFDKQSGQAITDVSPENAMITLLNTGLAAGGEIKQPDIPIYITMVMDASGSMASSQQILKDAAKLALTNVPNNAFFSVVQFDEEIVLLQDFTENQSALSFAIDQMKTSGRGTCLYDAAFTAVEAMEQAPVGRRAVILFTDGKDETRDGSVCSQHTYRELVDKAMSAQVPIHTIGLSVSAGNINTVELENLAASTGGFSAIGNESQLKRSFEQIMLGLKAQWMVESVIYPRQGDNNAVLTMNLQEFGEITTSFIINSSKEYPGPPSPVSAKLDGFALRPETMSYDVQLSFTSPELINYLKVAIWEESGGAKVTEFIFENIAQFNTLNIPTSDLVPERQYQMRIVATDDKNIPFVIFRDQDGKQFTELTHVFTFDPSGVLPQLTIQSVIQDNNDLIIQVATTNPILVKSYDGWLINEDTNTVVPNSTFTSEILPNGSGSITIPMSDAKVESGQYTILLRALGDGNSVFTTQEYNGIVYEAQKVSIFDKIFSALRASPIFFYLIIGIILVVIAFLMIYNWREKSLSGTPVMQGRLGGKVGKNKKKGQQEFSPFAANEPIHGKIPQQPDRHSSAAKPATPAYNVPVMPSSNYSAGNISPDQLDKTIVGGPSMLDATQIAPMFSSPSLSVVKAPHGVVSQGQRITIQPLPFTIGRVGASLTLNEVSVSRLHAQITMDSQTRRYVITDMNSSNGTKVNGAPLNPGQPMYLNNGCRVQIGPAVEFVFEGA